MITVQEIKRSKPKYFVKGVQLTTEKGIMCQSALF